MGKEILSFAVNANKASQKARRGRTLCFLRVGAVVIVTVLVFLLSYTHTQNRMSLPRIEEQGSSEVQQGSAGPSTAESQNTDSASIPQSTEKAASLASQPELAAPSVVESQNPESTSLPNSVQTAESPAQQAEVAASPVTESLIESASIPQSIEHANPPVPKTSNPKLTGAKKARQNSANKRRHVHRKTIPSKPAYTDFIDSWDIPHKTARNELHTPKWMGGW